MSFFKNKHVITAMIVAPVLAIASYYLVDLTVKEQPIKAVAGQTYQLIAKSNCRFSSGACDLENGNFKSTITIANSDGKQTLLLNANNSLQQAAVGFVTSDGQESGPFELTTRDLASKQWFVELTVPADASTTLRVALSANNSHYYSETNMGFATYETSFNKDFRKQN
ncbi:MAG: hypothetical protein AB8C40_09595 [Gammaproteobacteria bacterium]